jgi:hypothetical protein
MGTLFGKCSSLKLFSETPNAFPFIWDEVLWRAQAIYRVQRRVPCVALALAFW